MLLACLWDSGLQKTHFTATRGLLESVHCAVEGRYGGARFGHHSITAGTSPGETAAVDACWGCLPTVKE